MPSSRKYSKYSIHDSWRGRKKPVAPSPFCLLPYLSRLSYLLFSVIFASIALLSPFPGCLSIIELDDQILFLGLHYITTLRPSMLAYGPGSKIISKFWQGRGNCGKSRRCSIMIMISQAPRKSIESSRGPFPGAVQDFAESSSRSVSKKKTSGRSVQAVGGWSAALPRIYTNSCQFRDKNLSTGTGYHPSTVVVSDNWNSSSQSRSLSPGTVAPCRKHQDRWLAKDISS